MVQQSSCRPGNEGCLKTLTAKPKDHTKFGPARSPVAVSPHEINLGHLRAELTRIDVLVRLAVLRWQQAGRDPNDAFRGLVIGVDDAVSLSAPLGGGWEVLAAGHDEMAHTASAQQADAAHEAEQWLALGVRHGAIPRLHQLAVAFGLEPFEQDALLLCLAPALDLRYEQLYGFLQNDINRKRPSVNLVLQLLGASRLDALGHMGRFAADAPLLTHQLLEYVHEPGAPASSLLGQALMIDRTVAGWLLGEYHPGSELGRQAALTWPRGDEAGQLLAESTRNTVLHAASLPNALLIFSGPDATAQDLAGQAVAASLHRPLLCVQMDQLLAQGIAADQAVRRALRDARLNQAVAFLQGWDACLVDHDTPPHLQAMLVAHPQTLVIGGRAAWQPHGQDRPRPVAPVEFALPDYAQRRQLWRHYLTPYQVQGHALDETLVAGQFALTSGQIRDAAAAARDRAMRRGAALEQADLFAGARLHSGARLGDMARKIEPRYGWDDIILPQDQIEILRELVATVRGRSKVLEEWGLGRKLASSRAVTVLFAGPPGVGKTMAAEVIALDLGLDLYKIDLSGLVSKYIGETEKNLERVFTEAQSSNAILFFDEADAIFGKRSGVKDAHDRYANLEVSYLLQRMEFYDGVTILATNLRSNLDEAFLRRLQFAIDIPFPDEKHRLSIWETLFPAGVARADDVDLPEMARRYKLAGGNIRNILVAAAYLAAEDGDVIAMRHLLHGTRREFQKMGRLVMEG